MQKNTPLFAFGLAVAVLICVVPFFYTHFMLKIICGLASGLILHVCAFKKLDFDDSALYVFVGFFIVLNFAFGDISSNQGANLLIYLSIYLLGSIPFGLILALVFAKVNIKSEGSKSIGATNVLRVVKQTDPALAKKLAIATVVLDFAKAACPILIAKFMGADANMLWSIGVFAVLGHCFSIYLFLDGGKGIATGAGVMAVLLPLELLVALFVWFAVGKVFRISSLASLAGALSFIIASFVFHYDMPEIHTHAPILIICFIIFYKHIPNIKRLIFKEECKVI